ncbi:MAG: nuclear transport factor 2 family protein [Flavobacterium sp.]|uniref:nuclear transport factor 2 family protein n=1 Tax=Flavobacterium sp. TaxID=239 RepID=UPI0011F4BA17|nr:nuclear transport factor 2 family protein [Flavobacterium sp.]RZJ67406.1 MAG: nuclear transport factor 2 family protein [Flavobacterium sp.]
MSLTHTEIVQDAESRLLQALVSKDYRTFRKMLHPEIVFTDESGQSYMGIEQIPYLNEEILSLSTCEILKRDITFFTNIAIVNVIELRVGLYRGMQFERKFRIMRTWKFNGRMWQLIAANLVLLPENESPCGGKH